MPALVDDIFANLLPSPQSNADTSLPLREIPDPHSPQVPQTGDQAQQGSRNRPSVTFQEYITPPNRTEPSQHKDTAGHNRTSSTTGSDLESVAEPDTSQMGRRRVQHEPDSVEPTPSSRPLLNGHANGHTRESSMNSSVETRRKHAVPESPSRLLDHERFSLDDEPPPPTPIHHSANNSFFDLPIRDRRNFLLLVLLYFLQGVPMGLAGGSVPFLLKSHLSYGQIGIFSLASYPYSLKLLWSPIVDAIWSTRVGRRKSWILPIQLCSGFGMLYMGARATEMMKAAGASDGSGVWAFTLWWFFLVFLCATQDIAVDGWALTLLSPPNLSYASTAQTVGLTAGQFLSFTVFLALNSPDFANRWFRAAPRKEGVLSLGGYLTFWGWAYLAVTAGLAALKREERTRNRDGLAEVYRSMLGILRIRNIQTFIVVHLIAKLGFQANDAVTNLKLLDKGFSTEDLALTVLIDFPFEIALGYYAGRWSTAYPALHVWCWAFVGRLVAAVVAQGVVMMFPPQGTTTWYLMTVIGSHIFSTFMSTVMFVAVSAFHARIADPVIGGTYMTLLAT